MRLYRIVKKQYEHTSLEDESLGAKKTGGRWNSKDVPIVYASYNVATAAMEVLVHIDWDLAPELALLAIDVPKESEENSVTIDHDSLPENWDTYPSSRALAVLGDTWIKSGSSLILKVPSAASKYEFNALLNPNHPDAKKCTLSVIGTYDFDGRFKSKS